MVLLRVCEWFWGAIRRGAGTTSRDLAPVAPLQARVILPARPRTRGRRARPFRYRTRCGTVYGDTGSFPGYRLFAASSANGRHSVVFSVNAQIVPGEGSPAVSNAIRRAQLIAVCRALS
jgi:hypothetical protein